MTDPAATAQGQPGPPQREPGRAAAATASTRPTSRGPLEVLGTLLHEAAHGLAQARGIQDTSRQGRYHNRRYATLAHELGLEVASVQPIGWSATTVPVPTADAYAGQLGDLAAALVLWRRQEHRISAGPRSRNLLAAACHCGRRIRVARATLAEAPILCAACQQPFQPADPDDTAIDT